MYICALHFLKMTILTILIKHSVTYSKFIFRRGYPNKMIPTKNYELILNDHYGSGRCCNAFQTHETFTINTKVGTLRSVQVAVEKRHNDDLPVSMIRFLYLIYCIHVCRSQSPMTGVRLFHRPNLHGLELCC